MRDLNDEHLRILRAADQDLLAINAAGRYEITGDKRPARREREQLQQWGLLGWKFVLDEAAPKPRYGIPKGDMVMTITDDGRSALGQIGDSA
jgi:hypothetical protein